MTPQAEVIAVTHFLGVPQGLVRPGSHAAGQNRGSESARLIECAGRCCYDSYGTGRSSEAYQENLREVRHGSVLEHFSLSFYLSGISRNCTHELVRHRHAAISQRSTRYVDEGESEWAWAPMIDPYAVGTVAWIAMGRLQDEARRLYALAVSALEDELVTERGLDRRAARKQARGAARGVLGGALSTALVWTVNLRTLRHFLELRATEHADGEIRLLANAVYHAAMPYCPEWLADYEEVTMADGIGFGLRTEWAGL